MAIKGLNKHRDGYTKLAFMAYLKNHPDERFFQAIRNFCGYMITNKVNFIGISADGKKYKDTFYIECDNEFSFKSLEETL